MTLNEKPTVTIVDTFELIAKVVLFICYTVAVIWVTTMFCDHNLCRREIMELRTRNLLLQHNLYEKTLLTFENIEYWLSYLGVKEPDIVKAMIILETGYGLNSKMVVENNNLLNIKLARQRETTAKGQRSGYAFYASYIDCLKDYAIWEKKYYKSGTDYFDFIKNSGFAEDTSYCEKIKIIYNKIAN